MLTVDEGERMEGALYRMKADPDLEAEGVYVWGKGDYHTLMGHLVEYRRTGFTVCLSRRWLI